MSSINPGLSEAGFTPLSLQEIREDLNAQLRLQFGNVDLSDQSVFGQLVGIFAASSSQLWQAGSALYAQSFPAGATGVAVDNILALSNMQRLPAAATVTDPTPATQANGVVRYGLRLLGAPGTVVPAGTLFNNGAAAPVTLALDADATIGPANNAQQVLYFAGVPTAGSYALTLTSAGGVTGTTAPIAAGTPARTTRFSWTGFSGAGYTLTLGGTATTDTLDGGSTAADVQAAIRALDGFGGVTVAAVTGGGFAITFPAGPVPVLTAAGEQPPNRITQAAQAIVAATKVGGVTPFTDVQLTDGAQTLTLDFGAYPAPGDAPRNGGAAIGRVAVASNSLTRGNTSIGVGVQIAVLGNPAQAIGTATATTTGSASVAAGQLTTVASPVGGLTGVTNDLDCLPGRAVETDSAAIARFRAARGATSSGSLGAVTQRVRAVPGVTQVVAFENTSNAAGQVLLFATPPSQGQFSLVVAGQTTALVAYNAPAAALQSAVRALTGLGRAQVTSYGASGYQLDFAGSGGGQAVPLVAVAQNTTQVALTPYFGRPPHSIEVVVEGGSQGAIVDALLAAAPAGVALYSNPALRTTATLTAGQQAIAVASTVGVAVGQTVEASGVPVGSTVVGLSEGTVTLSAAATAPGSQVPVSFAYAPLVKDAAGNPVIVGFSRPQSVIVWVSLTLVTDERLVPGDATSGLNSASQWDPAQMPVIAQRLIDLVNATPIGGSISARGTNGLVGSFRDISGLVDFELAFDLAPNPTNVDSITLQSSQAATAQSDSVVISYS